MSAIKKAIFAGGCFWCMVKPFDELPGIISIVAGYTGGHIENPTYEEVCAHSTGHVEAVEITYDEDKMPYRELVEIFFRSIDPTDPEGQFHDRGETYHTAIFYQDEVQKEVAEKYKKELEKTGYLRLNKENIELQAGDKATLKISGFSNKPRTVTSNGLSIEINSAATIKDVRPKFKTSSSKIKVNKYGVITAKKKGTAKVNVSLGTQKFICTVVVK